MKQPRRRIIRSSVFLGYCLKEYCPVPEEWRQSSWSAHVTEVCSASDCLSSRPPGWIERWDFNRASCWNEEVSALACVPPNERSRYCLYAYRAIPLVFDTASPPYRLAPKELFDYKASLPELPSEPGFSRLD